MLRSFLIVLVILCSLGALRSEELISKMVGQEVNLTDLKPGKGGLTLSESPNDLIEALRDAEEFTVAFRFSTELLDQDGPARMFSISKNTSLRNLTIGQEGEKIEVRLRTTKTSSNGLPGFSSESVLKKGESVHLALMRERDGMTTLFLDGEEVARKMVQGSLSNWDADYALILFDEASGGRPWRGSLRDLVVYPRALDRSEIDRLRDGEKPAEKREVTVVPSYDANASLFETKVTTLLTKHCLECHDSATAEGDLDLSRALASHTEDGILVPGDAAGSLFWESIEHDDMPHKREPLSAEEKAIFKEWIEGGASWTVDFIDPAIYSRQADTTPAGARRLTVNEYINTVRDLFGVDIEADARELLPPEVRADGFSNTSYNLGVDLKHIEAYGELAGRIVEKMDVAAFAKRFSSKRDHTDRTVIPLIEEMTVPILRGPPMKEDTALFRGISTAVASVGGDFDEAIGYVIEAMLQSPRFIYRIEKPSSGDKSRRVSDYELASRLSYTLWGSTPDRELLKKAEDRDFDRDGVLDEQVKRMLRDPRAVGRSLEFCAEWLNLGRLSHLQPSAEHFPDWDPQLASAMRAETLQFFEEVVWKEQLPLGALFEAQYSFLTPELATHYGLPEIEKAGKVDLSPVPERGGLLTHGSLLTIGGDEASMVSRGLFVLNDLLRGVIKDPPPCVDTTPVENTAQQTRREIAMERVANKSCGGCHAKFEPLAYGFEKFDGLGAFSAIDEHGNALREDGEVLFPGDAEPVPFETVGELMGILAESARVKETMTWKLTQFALGRPLTARDAGAVSQIHAEALSNGGRYTDVMAAIAKSRLIRFTEPELDHSH